MKNFTRKTMLVAASAMMSTVAFSGNVVDRTIPGYEKASYNETTFYKIARPSFAIGDYNNDGFMDLYSCGLTNHGYIPKEDGTGNKDGYWPYGFLYTNQSNTSFLKASTDRDENKIMLTGLPSAIYADAHWVDFNNDGYLDFFISRPYEGDYGWLGGYYGAEENRRGTEIYMNLGPDQGYKFQRLEGTDFAIPDENRNRVNEGQGRGSIVFGDYNKDGFIDILMTGFENGEGKGRYVNLYKNVNGTTFEKQDVAHPMENELYREGLYLQDEDGLFTDVPTMRFKPMSHGCVSFGDLDNDGWLDIVCTGYSESRGLEMRFYKNLQNGEYQDVTDMSKAQTGAFRVYESKMKMVDVDQDGWLDIVLFGTGQKEDRPGESDRKLGSILMNQGATKPFTFVERTESESGLPGVSGSNVILADYNNDGAPDLLYKGWNNDCSWNFFLACYKTSKGSFEVDVDFSRQGQDDITKTCGFDLGAWDYGDFNGDGILDFVEAEYTDGGDYFNMWLSKDAEEPIVPATPVNVAASAQDGLVTITWEDDENLECWTHYNVRITDTNSNKIVSATTHALANGKLTTYPEFSSLIRTKEYSMKLPNGSYKIEVSAINYGYQASEFASTNFTVSTSNIAKNNADKVYTVLVSENGITVQGADNAEVDVFAASGVKVAGGVVNEQIALSANGIYFVKVAGETIKVIK